MKDSSISINDLLDKYSNYLKRRLLGAELTPKLHELRSKLSKTKWLVVSGGEEKEIKKIFKKKLIYNLFDSGIFGSPLSKEEIIKREISNNNIRKPAIYLGDSKYDYNVSKKFGIDFIFVSNWTEFSEWKSFCKQKNIFVVKKLANLL